MYTNTYTQKLTLFYLPTTNMTVHSTRSSAVAARPRDASCHWIFRYVTQNHWRSL